MNFRTEELRLRFGFLYRNLDKLTDNELKRHVEMLRIEINNVMPIINLSDRVSIIEDTICDFFNLSKYELKQKKRDRKLVYARAVIYYFLRKYTDLSLHVIGERFKKNHATVIHSINDYNVQLLLNKSYEKNHKELELLIEESLTLKNKQNDKSPSRCI